MFIYNKYAIFLHFFFENIINDFSIITSSLLSTFIIIIIFIIYYYYYFSIINYANKYIKFFHFAKKISILNNNNKRFFDFINKLTMQLNFYLFTIIRVFVCFSY